MKLTAIFLLLGLMQVSAKGTAQTITWSGKNVPIEKVFSAIKKQTNYVFFYRNDDVSKANRVTVDLKNASLEEALQKIFNNQPLAYSVEGNTVVVTVKPGQSPFEGGQGDVTPPPVDVHGRILNENGEPVLATVMVKGTNKGTTTNNEGYFELKGVDQNAILVITASNIETREIALGVRTDLSVVNVKMKVTPLDEMQIIAYGQTSKRLQTGNVSSVKSEDIEKAPVGNVLLAIAGRIPGVFITQTTGVPGGGISVQIQGQNSIQNGNDPLYVVDGIPYPSRMLSSVSFIQNGGNPLNFINPQDIESIEVLKDADATAIYGSRAANGAILITTKNGKAGQTRVNINVQRGFGEVAQKIKMMNTEQYLAMRREAYQNDGLPVPNSSSNADYSNYDLTVWDQNRYTDWQKVLIGGKAQYTDAQGSVSGGNTNTQFLLGTNYHKETTVFPGDFADQRGSAYFNANNTSGNQKFKLHFSASYTTDQTNLPSFDLTEAAIKMVPNAPALYNSNGSLNWQTLPNGNSTWTNPLALSLITYNNKTNNLLANSELSYEILHGLILKSSFGYNRLESAETSLMPQTYLGPDYSNINLRNATYSNKSSSSWIIEPQLTYRVNRNFGAINVLLGTTFQRNNNVLMSLMGSGFNNDAQLANIQAAALLTVDNSLESIYNYNAVFSRLNYVYKEKYIVNLEARRDGSSRFGSENLFHNFYSVASAWMFSNENWFKRTFSFLSFGKLRLSYGTTGNDQIGDYSFLSLYSTTNVNIPYTGIVGLAPNRLNNPFLQWEETRKANIGIDLGVLSNHLLLNLNYYQNRSSNQLISYLLPVTTGFNFINKNFDAMVQNSGFEAALNVENIRSKGLTWSSHINFTINRNKLVSFPGLSQSPYANSLVIGKTLNIEKVYKFGGIDPLTGEYQFIKSDKTLTGSPASPDDLNGLVDRSPKFYGGFQNNISYKGLSLDVLFQFVRQIARNPLYFGVASPGYFYMSGYNNQPVDIIHRWTKPGDVSQIAKLTTQYVYQFSNAEYSDVTWVDASYIRLKNLSLSWSIPRLLTEKLRLQNVKVYTSAQNLLTVTKFLGDPEIKSIFSLPPLRTVTVGVQVSL